MDKSMECLGSESSEESVSDEFFHDSIEARKDNREFSDIDNSIETVTNNNNNNKPSVLDLRNVPSIANIGVKSDDETSEKLSAVIEQPEAEHLVISEMVVGTNADSSAIRDVENPHKIICKRIKSLQAVIIDLREQFNSELSLWRKEREEFQSLRERSDILALEEATAAARAAAQAYAAESPLSNELGNMLVDLNPVQSLSELTILEYEKKLAKYQDALALAQAEKRYNMRRNLIAETYRRRLVEVERLCNDELEKIRQCTNTLQPLRVIASQWCIQNDGNHGDVNREWINSTITSEKLEKHHHQQQQQQQVTKIYDDRETRKSVGNIDGEVNMIPEFMAARFIYSASESSKYERHHHQAVVKNSQSWPNNLVNESNSSLASNCACAASSSSNC